MSSAQKQKLQVYQGTMKPKPSNASMLFPEIQKELVANPKLAGNLAGLFIIEVLQGGKRSEEWFLSFYGKTKGPTISKEKPLFPQGKQKVQVAIIEIEDKDILKFVTGGLHGLKALSENRIRIAGDVGLASQLEDVFLKTGGIEKAKEFLKKAAVSIKSKL
jgi:hypothetical protein